MQIRYGHLSPTLIFTAVSSSGTIAVYDFADKTNWTIIPIATLIFHDRRNISFRVCFLPMAIDEVLAYTVWLGGRGNKTLLTWIAFAVTHAAIT